jgi:hypothetical protein
MAQDPYKILGISRGASEQEVRAAYRRAVQRYHPDHNNGSEESERRFEEVQDAYARIRGLRSGSAARGSRTTGRPQSQSDPGDSAVQERLAELERQLREARERAAQAARAAREAAAERSREAAATRARTRDAREQGRASDEELGYFSTDDSLSKILSDAKNELFGRIGEAREHPGTKRVTGQAADLLDDLGAMLRGERRNRRGD